MTRVMLWGAAGDGPFDAVRAQLESRGVGHFVLEQARSHRFSIDELPLEDISSVYVRTYDTARVLQRAGHAPGSEDMVRAAALEQALYAWLSGSGALLVNDFAAMASNGSKPYQAEIIRAHGLEIPETLVTTDPDAARSFIAAHASVIYKSVSGARSIVSRLGPEAMERLDDVAWCPTQFQAYVPGIDYRAHVVGRELYAARIICDADDYRYAGRFGKRAEIQAAELPAEIADRCCALARGLGLAFAGVDLRRTPEGRWYCFEVNPSPGFTYYEAHTGQPIAAAVARLLERH